MDTVSYALGLATGAILATVVFAYAFYKYKTDTREKHLKDYTELKRLVKKLETESMKPEVVTDDTEEVLDAYIDIETLAHEEVKTDGTDTEKREE